jgi:hypothetical protein
MFVSAHTNNLRLDNFIAVPIGRERMILILKAPFFGGLRRTRRVADDYQFFARRNDRLDHQSGAGFGSATRAFPTEDSRKVHSDWNYAWIPVTALILGCRLGTLLYKMLYKNGFQPQNRVVVILASSVLAVANIKGQKIQA